jgi:hypothetical protein
VQLLTRYYRFQRVQSGIGEHLYQVQVDDGVQSELRTRPEAVMWSNSPNQSIAVELELARPGSQRLLPPRPTGLQIPPAPPAPTAAASQQATGTKGLGESAKSAAGSYFEKVRHATPGEEGQLHRWPN